MQAIRRRTQDAQRRVTRRAEKQAARRNADALTVARQKIKERYGAIRANKKIDRQQRWEEWYLGPLRSGGEAGGGDPTEDGGVFKRTRFGEEYRFNEHELSQIRRFKAWREMKKQKLDSVSAQLKRQASARQSSPEDHIVKGGRVVIRAHEGPVARYRGRIGTVLEIDRENKVCSVQGMTMSQSRASRLMPAYKLFNTIHYDPTTLVQIPVPLSQLRPVKTIINGSGKREDVVLGRLTERDLIDMGRGLEAEAELLSDEVEPGQDFSSGPESEDERLAREQASANLTPEQVKERFPVSRPKKPEAQKKPEAEKKDLTTDSDTLRLELDNQTWTPTLLRAPLPGTVIDELRGKYSKFRTRHDPEFVKAVQRTESAKMAYEAWVKRGGGVLDTPWQEVALRSQAQRKEARRIQGRVLDDEVLEGIGKLMWDSGMRLDEKEKFETAQRWEEKYANKPKGVEIDPAVPSDTSRGSVEDVVAS